MISNEYLEWLECRKEQDENLLPLTNTQQKFIEWLLEHDNGKVIMQIGNLTDCFISVRQHLKDGGSIKEKINETI